MRIEVDLTDDEFNDAGGEIYAQMLQSAGCRIGPDGWLLRVRFLERPITEEERKQLAAGNAEMSYVALVKEVFAPGETTPAWVSKSNDPNQNYIPAPGLLRKPAVALLLHNEATSDSMKSLPHSFVRANGRSCPWPVPIEPPVISSP